MVGGWVVGVQGVGGHEKREEERGQEGGRKERGLAWCVVCGLWWAVGGSETREEEKEEWSGGREEGGRVEVVCGVWCLPWVVGGGCARVWVRR